MNKKYAAMFVNAIKKLTSNEDSLNNLESYLSHHFDVWMEKFANTPESLASELKQFAEMEISK